MATYLISGGTGLVGTRLSQQLADAGHEVIILSRKAHPKKGSIRYGVWDVQNQTIDPLAIQAADYIIHLAGAGVADKRWTAARKQEILDSRTQSSALLVKALKEIPHKVQAVISASAIGWYGSDTAASLQNGFTEDAPADKAYLGETCRLWEESISPIEAMGIRLVKLRIGIVLSTEGGALVEFRKPLMGGVAAILGSGQQMISWVHIHDLCAMFRFAAENELIAGVFNAVADTPVNNKTLTLALARQLRGRWFIPVYVPAFVLKLVLGEMSIEVLKSATVSNKKILAAGFHCQYPTIQTALQQLFPK
jgi:uncharacterized protein (TIGR01777 family)